MNPKFLPERIRAARGRVGKTMKEIAEACGVSAQLVHKWEAGKCVPRSGALMAFAMEADCSVEWLMHDAPLDFRSTDSAPQGKHAKYWVREAIAELIEWGVLKK
jgi:transcriptional regulator with XRE-family HTH domain